MKPTRTLSQLHEMSDFCSERLHKAKTFRNIDRWMNRSVMVDRLMAKEVNNHGPPFEMKQRLIRID